MNFQAVGEVKSLKIEIKTEHLDGANFIDNDDCPLARALKADGYTGVKVYGWSAKGQRYGQKYLFTWTNDNFNCSKVDDARRAGNQPFTISINRVDITDIPISCFQE